VLTELASTSAGVGCYPIFSFARARRFPDVVPVHRIDREIDAQKPAFPVLRIL